LFFGTMRRSAVRIRSGPQNKRQKAFLFCGPEASKLLCLRADSNSGAMFLYQQKQASWCPDRGERRRVESRGRIRQGPQALRKSELLHFFNLWKAERYFVSRRNREPGWEAKTWSFARPERDGALKCECPKHFKDGSTAVLSRTRQNFLARKYLWGGTAGFFSRKLPVMWKFFVTIKNYSWPHKLRMRSIPN